MCLEMKKHDTCLSKNSRPLMTIFSLFGNYYTFTWIKKIIIVIDYTSLDIPAS